MKTQIISQENFVVNQWAGGKTTQLVIYPEASTLSERNFDFRISSATFNSTSSKFSDFSSYQRYLLPIIGTLSVEHQGLYKRNLKSYETEYFLGSWKTSSTNSEDCKDFNFIVRDGLYSNLSVLSETMSYIPKKSGKIFLYSLSNFQISLISDTTEILNVPQNSLLVVQEEDILNNIIVKSSIEPVIICEVIV